MLAVVVIFVGQFVVNTDFKIIGDSLKRMPFTFALVVGLSFLAYISATLAWKLCLGKSNKELSLGRLFMMRHVSEVLTVFNPTSVIAGEGLKLHYLKQVGIPSQKGMSSILISRILIILSAILLSILSAAYLVMNTAGGGEIEYVLISVLFFSGFGYLLARMLLHSRMYLHKIGLRLQKILGQKLLSDTTISKIKEVNFEMYKFYISNKKQFYVAFGLSILHWIFGACEFYVILQALKIDISIVDALAIEMGVILFKTAGAIVPGQIGVEEYGNKVMLETIGVESNEIWIVVSIIRRARQLFWLFVAVLFYYFMAKMPGLKKDN